MQPLTISYKPHSAESNASFLGMDTKDTQMRRTYIPQTTMLRPSETSGPGIGDPDALLVKTLELENKTLRDQIASLLEREKLAKLETTNLREQLAETEKRSGMLTDEISSVISKEMGDLKMRFQTLQADRDSVATQFEALKNKLVATETELTGTRDGIDMLKTYYSSVSNDIMSAVRDFCKSFLPTHAIPAISSAGLISLAHKLDIPVPNMPASIRLCIDEIHEKVYNLNICLGDVRIAADTYKETANMVKERLIKERDNARSLDSEHRAESERLRDQLNMLRTDTDNVVRENKNIKPLLASLENENAGLREEISVVSEKLRQSQGEINILTRKIEVLEAENDSLQGIVSVNKDQIAELRGTVTIFRMERDEATQRLTELEKNLITLTAESIEERSASRGMSMSANRPPPRTSQPSLRGHVDRESIGTRSNSAYSPSGKSEYENPRLMDLATNGKLRDSHRVAAALASDRFEHRSPGYYD